MVTTAKPAHTALRIAICDTLWRMGNINVRTDNETDRELEQLSAELRLNTSETVRKAIHLAWFTAMQERMRRESAEIAADPEEQAEAARIREWARYLAS